MPGLKMQPSQTQYKLAFFTCLLAFCVILVGAYVRLSDAGLGCPDWPGCYGQILAPSDPSEVGNAYAERPLHTAKAWKEMIHRYLAGSLGLAILLLAAIAWRNRKLGAQPVLLPLLLLVLVVFQAALGMWTVTLLVKPAIVTAHLLGGFATLSLLWLLVLRLKPISVTSTTFPTGRERYLILISLVAVILQITLGGWTSTNYAAFGCSDFPACYADQWWPRMDFREAFVIWRGLGVNYEFGVLDNDARTAIHMTHRMGALVTLVIVGWLAISLIRRHSGTLRKLGLILSGVLLLQVSLGITNVLAQLPLPIAVAHNGVAALLLLTLLTIFWLSSQHE